VGKDRECGRIEREVVGRGMASLGDGGTGGREKDEHV
jgi:hypothetical protein